MGADMDEAIDALLAIGPGAELIRLNGEYGESRRPEIAEALAEPLRGLAAARRLDSQPRVRLERDRKKSCRSMKQLADGVWKLAGFPPNVINVFLIDDVLIDAGVALGGPADPARAAGPRRRCARAHPRPSRPSGRKPQDLRPNSRIPFWVGEHDADAAEDPSLIGQRQPDHPMAQFMVKALTGPGHPVDRKLGEGDDVGGFQGARRARPLARARRLLARVRSRPDRRRRPQHRRLADDDPRPEPSRRRSSPPIRDESEARLRRLGTLEPNLVLVGHGPPYRDTKKFVEFCASV